jgi:hypothetical protein
MMQLPLVTPKWFMRCIALLLLVSIPTAIVVGVVLPARQLVVVLEADLATKRATLARLNAVITYGNEAAKQGPSITADIYATDFLTGTQNPVIIAELQNRLRAVAIDKKSELNSVNALPSKSVDGRIYLGLRAVFRGHLKDIQQIVHFVETSSPLLFIDRAVMRLDVRPMGNGDAIQSAVPALIAELDIYGARASDAASGPEAIKP